MINTDNYIRFTRVDAVAETATGVLADLHREQLRIDVVRPDVVRIKISRGGEFDESPTYAVCIDPLADPVPFRVERDDDQLRVITDACTVTLGLDPFRIDVHRADGTPVVETAQDDRRRVLGVRDLNDSFTLRRRCRQEDAIFGWVRSRSAQPQGPRLHLWNTDVLSPFETLEFTRDLAADDPAVT
jgi:alpha-glucosidase